MSCEEIFVFGSNLAGRHGKGAAVEARQKYGAVYGVGEGRTGNAYAIPTKDHKIRSRSFNEVKASIETFLTYARDNPELKFRVTAVGCGLAGFMPCDIAPLFAEAPPNCDLPDGLRMEDEA